MLPPRLQLLLLIINAPTASNVAPLCCVQAVDDKLPEPQLPGEHPAGRCEADERAARRAARQHAPQLRARAARQRQLPGGLRPAGAVQAAAVWACVLPRARAGAAQVWQPGLEHSVRCDAHMCCCGGWHSACAARECMRCGCWCCGGMRACACCAHACMPAIAAACTGFDDGDLRISAMQLRMFLDDAAPAAAAGGGAWAVPYEALRYTAGECNYGGTWALLLWCS